jgi:hypothetical protein
MATPDWDNQENQAALGLDVRENLATPDQDAPLRVAGLDQDVLAQAASPDRGDQLQAVGDAPLLAARLNQAASGS